MVGDARIDECPSCEGVFVEHGVLRRLLDPGDLGGEVLAGFAPGTPELTTRGGPMYVKCPRCRGVMNRRQFASGARVVVDVCRGHGVWFDTAELRAVAAFAEAGGMARAAAADAERAAKERAAAQKELAALRAENAQSAIQRRRHPQDGLVTWLVERFRR
jgi:Zn-finger nucleic acid-binding protein